jgi:hypothetical protein
MKLEKVNKVLDQFESISLAEMDKVKLMDRVETKFVFSLDDLPELLNTLKKDYKVAKIADKLILSYESFYFDDENLFFYKEHHRGRKNRFKVRYRHYVDSDLWFFEIKHKKKGRTNKTRVQANYNNGNLGSLEKSLLDSTSIPKLDLTYVLSNSYKRITLVNKKTVERLTLDLDLSFSFEKEENGIPDIVIAELKQERVSRISPFYKMARKMLLKPYRISKYCTGLIQLDGSGKLKYNRFKKNLLKLNKTTNYGVHLV